MSYYVLWKFERVNYSYFIRVIAFRLVFVSVIIAVFKAKKKKLKICDFRYRYLRVLYINLKKNKKKYYLLTL